MAALLELLPPPLYGQLFVSFDTLREHVEDWSIREKFHFVVNSKDKTRVIYICKDQACQWRLRGSLQIDGSIKVTTLVTPHSCIAGLVQRTSTSHQNWLLRHIPQYLHMTKETEVFYYYNSYIVHELFSKLT